jgi:hypothetical protein
MGAEEFTAAELRVLIKAAHMYAARAVHQQEADIAADLERRFRDLQD